MLLGDPGHGSGVIAAAARKRVVARDTVGESPSLSWIG
jgi:hypothetical protein